MRARIAARLAAVLLVVTAGLFVIGVNQESGDQHTESTNTVGSQGQEDAHGSEGGERAEQRSAEGQDEAGHGTSEERKIFGLDPESPGLVTVVVVLSLALAAGLWFTGNRGVAAGAAVFAALAAVFDVAEVRHQLDDERNGLAALAATIAIGHAIAALTAGRAALRPDAAQEVS